ncbi:MAG: serine protease [bacterium]|nr:serine protease [bacterium]
MKHVFGIFLLMLIFSIRVSAQGGGLTQNDIRRISASVVQIAIITNDDVRTSGSGTIVTANGMIFTNQHVIEGAQEIAILFLDSLEEPPVFKYLANVVASFPDEDFAILQIDRDSTGAYLDMRSLNLPFLDPTYPTVELGERVYVFGYPAIGDGYLVLVDGMITTIQNGMVNGERMPVWYQTDAEISPGNSGGVAVNGNGELVGIPTLVQTETETGARLGQIRPFKAVSVLFDEYLAYVNDPENSPTPMLMPQDALPTPLATPTLTVGSELSIELTSLTHNIGLPDQTDVGMRISTRIMASGLMGQNLRIAIFFFWADGTPISSEKAHPRNRAPNGQLTIQQLLTPGYPNTLWDDYWFWLPYIVFPSQPSGSYEAYIEAQIGLEGMGFSAWSARLPFTLNYP